MKDDAVYVQHLLECIARIEKYTKAGRTEFMPRPSFKTAWFAICKHWDSPW